jgi:hypothetical protein
MSVAYAPFATDRVLSPALLSAESVSPKPLPAAKLLLPELPSRMRKRANFTSVPLRLVARFTIRANRASRKFLQRSMSGRTGSKPGPRCTPLPLQRADAFLTFVGRKVFFPPIHGLILGPFSHDGYALSPIKEATSD